MASIHPVCLVVTQHTQSHTQSHYNHAHHHTQAHTVTHRITTQLVTQSHIVTQQCIVTVTHAESHTVVIHTHTHCLHSHTNTIIQFLKITCIHTWDVIQNYSCHCPLFPLRCGRVLSAHSRPGQTVLLLQLLQRALNR